MQKTRARLSRIGRKMLPQRLRRTHVDSEKVLDGLNTAFTLLGAVADGVASVPGLKVAASVAKEIIVIAQTARQNKEDCIELAQQVSEYMSIVVYTYKAEVDDVFHENVELFYHELIQIRDVMRNLARRKRFSRLWHHELDKRQIEEAKARLQHVFTRFDLTGSILVYQSCQRTEISIKAMAVKVDRVLAVQLFFL